MKYEDVDRLLHDRGGGEVCVPSLRRSPDFEDRIKKGGVRKRTVTASSSSTTTTTTQASTASHPATSSRLLDECNGNGPAYRSSNGLSRVVEDIRAAGHGRGGGIKADPDWNASNWDSAYSWGNHASANYTGDIAWIAKRTDRFEDYSVYAP